jgi:hypothetical protein
LAGQKAPVVGAFATNEDRLHRSFHVVVERGELFRRHREREQRRNIRLQFGTALDRQGMQTHEASYSMRPMARNVAEIGILEVAQLSER